ncbi:AraC-like DNA-binding protein [Dyadobacter jejuensis]|uniref:AraC-like DNA-binding protein n=1 Tax=Dyadobacter jejuensis TaxID=1082580 RepID=A0A316BDC1_9BACT|nr:AraC family transcriptional regulator [Dyadobacter jejuensis]PWJ60487.1 AraC-like DNA-binding protein [Dyadobacter jejuensis]
MERSDDISKRKHEPEAGAPLRPHASSHHLSEAFFAITTIEEEADNRRTRLAGPGYYEVTWFTDVESDYLHVIDGNQVSVVANQVYFTVPGQKQSLEPRGARGFRMAIAKDFFEVTLGSDVYWLVSAASNFSVVIPSCSLKVLNMLTDLIRMEYIGNRRSAILGSYLRSWFLHCIEVQKRNCTLSAEDPRLQVLIETVDRNYRRQHQVAFYAKRLCVSAKRLNEVSRKSFGKTISQLINDRLILEAKREMGDIQKPIKEISYELGFSEPSYFTRFFRKQTGCSPQDFRKKVVDLK